MRFLLVCLAACSADPVIDGITAPKQDSIVLDTATAEARAKYDENVAFAQAYKARCQATTTLPRVIVQGFGRFANLAANSTSFIVQELVPTLDLDEEVTASMRVTEHAEICGIVVPVSWDLAAIVLAKEIDAFRPDAVFMNGVADSEQPISLELGSINAAQLTADVSEVLTPARVAGKNEAPIIAGAESTRPNLLSWGPVLSAAYDVLQARPSSILRGVEYAPYPRNENAYLCNNVTFVTGYLMDHPGESIALLEARPAIAGRVNQVNVSLANDFSHVPRVFTHWPTRLVESATELHTAALALSAMIEAQLNDAEAYRPAAQIPHSD